VTDALRQLPSVHDVLEALPERMRVFPHGLLVEEIRRAIAAARDELRAGATDIAAIPARVEAAVNALAAPSLQPVINATGVVLHTNLGRAPLGPFVVHPGYSNLEYDLAAGKRGNRDTHTSGLLERILGAPGIAVNNNAAAVYLALNELAAGYEVIVSRGELIEIGDGFRIPEIMARSGAVLREAGTTNRTRIDDYRAAINERTRVLLRVHPSNFRISGFTARPEIAELAALARERNLILYEDIGSGCLIDLRRFGIDEPLVTESLQAGADLVSFSGDKLLGGPQAGILSGKPELIQRLRRNPMFRALRLDKCICQALENTLRHILLEQWHAIPTLFMIRQSKSEIRARAERLNARIQGRVIEGESVAGGGSTPEQKLPTWLIALNTGNAAATERRLRTGTPPVIARIEDDCVVLDLRTVFPDQEEGLVRAVQCAQARS
jgi:L-seryl-tRNA(Ser) seleniumtransferase